MKYLLLSIFLLFNVIQMSAGTGSPAMLISEYCPNPPGGDQFTVFQDLNSDGTYDWVVHHDCYGCITEGPLGGTMNELGIVGPASNRPNETRSFTTFTTPTGKEGWIVRSYNSVTGQTYYTLTSSEGNTILEILPPPSMIMDNNSKIIKDFDANNSNLSYLGTVKIYDNQSYEFKASKDGLSWSNRVYNKVTGETYYTVKSMNGHTEIIYPDNNKTTHTNPSILEDNHAIKVFPNPIGENLNFSYISDKQSNIEISILDINGNLTVDSVNCKVIEGENSLNIDLKNVVNGKYILRVKDGSKILTSSIVINK